MSDQLTLFGEAPTPPPRVFPTWNLFFAVIPDSVTAARLETEAACLSQKFGLEGKPLKTNRLHVSLQGFSDDRPLPDGLIDAARQAGNHIALPEFDIEFDTLAAFSSHRDSKPIVLFKKDGNVELRTLLEQLGLALGPLLPKGRRSFTPHMTFMYGKDFPAEHSVGPIVWRATQVVLVLSHVGKSMHEHLGAWKLR